MNPMETPQRQGDGSNPLAKEQDRLLPVANIIRIMRRTLPANAKVAKDAKEVIQECVSEFIGFITSEASERLIEDKRKTITGDDIIESMKSLGFDCFVPCLEVYLNKYREAMRSLSAADLLAQQGNGSPKTPKT